jgi:2-aminoethylphosphonate transport system ATP-binding protein
VRPHDFRFSRTTGEPNSVTGTVLSVQWQGDVHNITINLGGETVRMTSAPMANPPRIGETIAVHFDPAEVTLVPEDASHG